MHYFVIAILLGFIGLMVFFSGLHFGFSIFAGCFSVLIVMAVYLETRPLSAPPTRLETFVARLWMVLRRASCVLVGMVFLLMGLAGAYRIYIGSAVVDTVVFPLACLALGCTAIWIGLYGWSRNLARDRDLHAQRRARYGGAPKPADASSKPDA
jgi:uncharacterized membrane protein